MPSTRARLLADNIPIDAVTTRFFGNGSTLNFTINGSVGLNNPNNLIVALDGAVQEPGIDYTVNDNTISFSTAPDSGAKVVVVYRNAPFTTTSIVPTSNTVTTNSIQLNAVTPEKLSLGAPIWDTAGNVTVNGNLSSRNLLLQGDNTNAYIRPTNLNSSLYLGSNNTNQVALLSNGNFGIGTLSPTQKLDVIGSIHINQNGSSLLFEDANGTSPAFSMQGDNNFVFYGTNASGAGRPIFNIIQRSNNSNFDFVVPVGMNNQPINNCPTTVKAYLNFDATIFALAGGASGPAIAPASTAIDQIVAGSSTGRWTWNSNWGRNYIGVIYYFNIGGNNTQYGGVDWTKGIQITSVNGTFATFKILGGPATVTPATPINGNGTTNGYQYQTFGIRNSFNISALTRAAAGRFRATFKRPMTNEWFISIDGGGNTGLGDGGWSPMDYINNTTKNAYSTVNYIDFQSVIHNAGTLGDQQYIYFAVLDAAYNETY